MTRASSAGLYTPVKYFKLFRTTNINGSFTQAKTNFTENYDVSEALYKYKIMSDYSDID